MKPLPISERDFLLAAAELLPARLTPLRPLPNDPWEFAQKCCVTFDERAVESGLPPERPFPDKEYLREFFAHLGNNTHLAVDKSGQIMITWSVAAFCLHEALTKRGVQTGWWCLNHETAADHVKRRIYRLYLSLPSTFAKPPATMNNGIFQVHHDGLDALPTSRIVPVAAESDGAEEAARKMRSQTWTRAVLDEDAFYRNGEELHASLMQRAGRVVAVSTPNGHGHHWRLMYHDLSKGQFEDVPAPTQTLVRPGVSKWERNGFACLRLHYSADPAKDPATEAGRDWLAREKTKVPSRKWAREMECDASVPAGLPVYCDGEKIVVAPQEYDPRLPLIRGWDYGVRMPFCVICQLTQENEDAPEILRVLATITANHILTAAFADKVLAFCTEKFPGHTDWHDWGDVAGRQHHDKALETNEEILHAKGIEVSSNFFFVEKRIELLQQIISEGRLHVDPVGTEILRTGLLGGYSRDDHGDIIKDDFYDHGCDALSYLASNLFGFKDEHRREVTAVMPNLHGPAPRFRPDGSRRASSFRPHADFYNVNKPCR